MTNTCETDTEKQQIVLAEGGSCGCCDLEDPVNDEGGANAVSCPNNARKLGKDKGDEENNEEGKARTCVLMTCCVWQTNHFRTWQCGNWYKRAGYIVL